MRVFMSNSGCTSTLRRARIHTLHLPWPTLKVVLDALQPVTHLTLDDVSAYWSQNPWHTWPNSLLPHLEVLEVLNMDNTFDGQCILSFARRRAKGGAELKKVRMTMYRKPVWEYPRMCSAVREFKRFGVDLEVKVENIKDVCMGTSL